jgi:hypothetical protein
MLGQFQPSAQGKWLKIGIKPLNRTANLLAVGYRLSFSNNAGEELRETHLTTSQKEVGRYHLSALTKNGLCLFLTINNYFFMKKVFLLSMFVVALASCTNTNKATESTQLDSASVLVDTTLTEPILSTDTAEVLD